MTDHPDTAHPDHAQIYLITPSEFDIATFADTMARCLDGTDVACVRLAMGSKDEDLIARAADALREITHARDVALVIDSHVLMVERLGLDGVHLRDGARSITKVRKQLGADGIIGAFCHTSRHDGMSAGELSADYVSFGPVGATALGDGRQADPDLFEWWSAMIEVPVVAEGALDETLIRTLAPHTDFFGLGDEVWGSDDPLATLGELAAAMR